jgi:Helix-turn-helix domain
MLAWTAIGEVLPGIPHHIARTTHATWPVWKGSTTKEVRFQPMARKAAVRLWHKLRRFERQTRQHGRQDGRVGRSGLAVAYSLIFDFLNHANGALYPSYAAIAKAAGISESSVYRGLRKLREAGVLSWLRRCVAEIVDDRFTLRQESNAYALLPCTQWRGYRETDPPPAPDGDTWGRAGDMEKALLAEAKGRPAVQAGIFAALAATERGRSAEDLAGKLAMLAAVMARKNP